MVKRSEIEFAKKLMARGIYFSGIYFLLSLFVRKKKAVIILAYHKIEHKGQNNVFSSTLGVDDNQFEQQMQYCAGHYQLISLSEACTWLQSGRELKKDGLVVTCDDGYANIYDFALPIFIKYKIKPIAYLPTGLIDSGEKIWHDKIEFIVKNSKQKFVDLKHLDIQMRLRNNLDKSDLAYLLMQKIKHLTPEEREAEIRTIASRMGILVKSDGNELLTWEQIDQLIKAGVEMGSHTVSHQILSVEALLSAETELQQSKMRIEAVTHSALVHFAYPDGKIKQIDPKIESMVRLIYRSAVTTEPGVNYPGCDLYRLKRIGVIKEMDLTYFKVKILLAKLFL